MMKNLLCAVGIAFALAGCASSGTMVTENQAAQFKKGESTRTQVLAALGQPNASSVLNDGSRIDVYAHVHAAANGASYIPIVGLMAGGANSTTNTATFRFDKSGVLQSVETSSGQAQVNTGLLNQ